MKNDVSLKHHLNTKIYYESELRKADDRRYAELNIEKEKALKIKEEADKTALSLARDIQVYKDEKANALRTQIERERGTYATQADLKGAVEKLEATLKPLIQYVSSQQGRGAGLNSGWIYLLGFFSLIGSIAFIIAFVSGHIH